NVLMSADEKVPYSVTLEGMIWGREYRRALNVDGDLADRLPALAIADDTTRSLLSEDEGRSLAITARIASPWTSFLSEAPGAQPSTVGEMRGYGTSIGY